MLGLINVAEIEDKDCCINVLILSDRTPEIISFVPDSNYEGGV